jgi:hypothetical protein
MKRMMINGMVVLLGLGFVSLALGCGSPCEDLAYRICECQVSRSQKELCKNGIYSSTRNLSISSDDEDSCQAILDSGECTCEALQSGNQSACGVSNPFK